MTSRVDEHRENVRGIGAELDQLLEGMDYCLDWKPDPSAWSARQVVYHLLETPPGGIHQVIWGVLAGDLSDFELWADVDNMTPERMGYDIEQLREDIEEFFRRMVEVFEAVTEEDLDEKSAVAHLRSRRLDEERTVQMLLEGLFARHWREHLRQIRELRESLGV